MYIIPTGGIPVLGPNGEPIAYDGQCVVQAVQEPQLQHRRIDVLFQARVDGQCVTFVIEDKTHSRDHGGQLARYLDSVRKDEMKEDLIKPIYFKTGYVFSDEREDVKASRYSILGSREVKAFLDGQEATRENEILRQYAQHLDSQMSSRAKAREDWDLNQDHVQWEFMRRLREELVQASGEWQPSIPSELYFEDEWTRCGLGRGSSSGAPWTQYRFARHLFWRLDAWPPRLRLMVCHVDDWMKVEESGEVLRKYRGSLQRALQAEGLSAVSVRVRTGYECTIGSVEIPQFQGVKVDEFLDRLTQAHIRFLELISRDRQHSGT